MIKHYVYADPHFYHKNIIEYTQRPFTSIQEMNETIINNHNTMINKRDKVFILGDFCLAGKDKTIALAQRLKGYKILILGNHDKGRSLQFWYEVGFQEVIKYPIIVQKQYVFSHEPMPMSQSTPYINVHGHIHNNVLDSTKHRNVSLDVTDFNPVELGCLKNC